MATLQSQIRAAQDKATNAQRDFQIKKQVGAVKQNVPAPAVVIIDPRKLSGFKAMQNTTSEMIALLAKDKNENNIAKLKNLRNRFLVSELGVNNTAQRVVAGSKIDPAGKKAVVDLTEKNLEAYREWVPQEGFHKFLNDVAAPVVGTVLVTVATAGIGAAAAGSSLSAGAVGTTAGTAAAGSTAKQLGLPPELADLASGEIPTSKELINRLPTAEDFASGAAEFTLPQVAGAVVAKPVVRDLAQESSDAALVGAEQKSNIGKGLILAGVTVIVLFFLVKRK